MPLFDARFCHVSSHSLSYTTSLHQSLMMDVPSKIWQPKPEKKYVPLDYSNHIDDNILVFTQYGNSVRRKPVTLASTRTDIHVWDADRGNPEFRKHFRLGATVDFATRGKIGMMVQKYWDVFHKAGVCLPVLGFEFTIDTGGSQPACCRKPNYGPHESAIILKQQDVLIANG
jgi:hypothetical protein